MADLDFIPKHIDPAGLTQKQIAYWRHHADKPAREAERLAREAEQAAWQATWQDIWQANLAAIFVPEIRAVPVWHEFGGRELSQDEHSALVAEAAELREWLIKWFGLVPGDKLCHRERQANSQAKPAGAFAGSDDRDGYLLTKALGKLRKNHHLIFLLYYGRLPAKGMVIDHINRDTYDNRIENLREITQQGNLLNRSNNDRTLPHGLVRTTMEGGRYHYIRTAIQVPSTGKYRTKNIRIAPWPKNPDGSPSLGEDGQPLRNEDELVAIATLAPLWRSWRAELYGVAAN